MCALSYILVVAHSFYWTHTHTQSITSVVVIKYIHASMDCVDDSITNIRLIDGTHPSVLGLLVLVVVVIITRTHHPLRVGVNHTKTKFIM